MSYTFKPDASPETSSVDGHVGESTWESWASKHARTSGNSASDSSAGITVGIYTHFSGNQYVGANVGFIVFDTSSLSGAFVSSSGVLYLTPTNGSDTLTGTEKVSLVGVTSLASDTAVAVGDYDAWTTTLMSDDKLTMSALVPGTEVSFTLNAAGLAAVNGAGVTAFALVIESWRTNTEPTWVASKQSAYSFAARDYGTVAYDPRLVIDGALAASEVTPSVFGASPYIVQPTVSLSGDVLSPDIAGASPVVIDPNVISLPGGITPIVVKAPHTVSHRSDDGTQLQFYLSARGSRPLPLGSATVTMTLETDGGTAVVSDEACDVIDPSQGYIGFSLDPSTIPAGTTRLWAEFKVSWGGGSYNVAPTLGRTLINLRGL